MLENQSIVLTVTLSFALCALVVAQIAHCVSNRRYTSLYWIAIFLVFAAPAVLDVLIGLPDVRRFSWVAASLSDARFGLFSAICFALVHVSVAIAIQRFGPRPPVRRPLALQFDKVGRWMVASSTLRIGLLLLFSGSCIAVFWGRGDLLRPWNDFVIGHPRPEYYVYTYFASTPLVAVLAAKYGLRHWMPLGVCAMSIGVAYCFGVRYYMFPFVGFVCMTALLRSRNSGLGKALRLGGIAAIAWVCLSLWGVIRDYNIRDSPLSLFERASPEVVYDRLLVGNELTTRLAYYKLMYKLRSDHVNRGLRPVIDSAVDALYPMIRRSLGIREPRSTSVAIYEAVYEARGSKVSAGATVFGCDWFNWAWPGAFVGGFIMGCLLRAVDNVQRRYPALLFCAAPMLCYQMIYWARGGLDFTLGLWTRAFPILGVLLIMVRFMEGSRGRQCSIRASTRCRPHTEASA